MPTFLSKHTNQPECTGGFYKLHFRFYQMPRPHQENDDKRALEIRSSISLISYEPAHSSLSSVELQVSSLSYEPKLRYCIENQWVQSTILRRLGGKKEMGRCKWCVEVLDGGGRCCVWVFVWLGGHGRRIKTSRRRDEDGLSLWFIWMREWVPWAGRCR